MDDYGLAWERQKADLVNQVRRLAAAGDIEGLTTLAADYSEVASILTRAMQELGAWSAQVAAEENGGVPVEPSPAEINEVAIVIASGLAAELAVSATRAATAAIGTGDRPDDVADAVAEYLDGLSDAGARRQAGGGLHGSVNAGRLGTFHRGPVGALYAHEVNDRNTCVPCSHVNGRWLGNTDDLEQVLKSYPAGAYGGYVLCLGGPACRGTIFGVWRQGIGEE